MQKARPGSICLLLAFVLGLVFWAVVSFFALAGAVILPFLAPLIMIVPVLGLIGWIFALIGWRKADRGESALAEGIVGGVLMLLTGFLFIPGILAIVGGALSRESK